MQSLLEPLHIIERFNLFLGHFPVAFDPEKGKYSSCRKHVMYCLIVTSIFKVVEALTFFGRQPVADAIGGKRSSMLFYLDVAGKYIWTVSNIWIIINMFLSRKDYVREMNELIKFLQCFKKTPVLPFLYKKWIALVFAVATLVYFVLVVIYAFLYIFKESNDKFLWINLAIYLLKSYLFLFVCMNEYFLVELLRSLLHFYQMRFEERAIGIGKEEKLYKEISQYLKLSETSQRLAIIFAQNYFAKALCCGMITSFVMYLLLLMYTDVRFCHEKFFNSVKLFSLWDVPFIFVLLTCTHAKVISDGVSNFGNYLKISNSQ